MRDPHACGVKALEGEIRSTAALGRVLVQALARSHTDLRDLIAEALSEEAHAALAGGRETARVTAADLLALKALLPQRAAELDPECETLELALIRAAAAL